MPKIPEPKFSKEETPWARWAQNEILALRRELDLRQQTETNVNKGQRSTLEVLGNNIVDLEGRVQDAIDNVTVDASQVVSGVLPDGRIPALDQSRITGTWTKGVNTTQDIFVPNAKPVVSGYVGVWINGDGRLGISASSVVYKQDFEPADTAALVQALLTVALVRFRYIEAVNELGDKATTELGAIAEYFDTIGLGEYVFRDADGAPLGISYERLTVPLIAVVQSLDARIRALEAKA